MLVICCSKWPPNLVFSGAPKSKWVVMCIMEKMQVLD